MKETKQTLISKMEGFLKNTNAKVVEIAKYVVDEYNKNARNVTISDIKDSLDIISKMVTVQQQVLPMENALKPTNKGAKNDTKLSKSGKTEEQLLEEINESFEEQPKSEADEVAVDKDSKKDVKTKKLTPSNKNKDTKTNTVEPKKEEAKKEEPKTSDKKESVVKTAPKVVAFPDSFKSTLGTLNARRDIKSIKELHDLIEDEVQLVICAYWTKRDLRQYDYDPMRVAKPVAHFEQDLDIQDIVYASENGIVISAVSLYTEVPFTYISTGFETDEDGLRYMNGVEYQIYEIVEE